MAGASADHILRHGAKVVEVCDATLWQAFSCTEFDLLGKFLVDDSLPLLRARDGGTGTPMGACSMTCSSLRAVSTWPRASFGQKDRAWPRHVSRFRSRLFAAVSHDREHVATTARRVHHARGAGRAPRRRTTPLSAQVLDGAPHAKASRTQRGQFRSLRAADHLPQSVRLAGYG